MIDKKNICRIILLGEGEPIEIPQECLEGYIELLDKVINQFKISDTSEGQTNKIKIITNNREYILAGEWMINGNRTDSTTYLALWNYLEGCEVWEPGFRTSYDTTGWTKLHSPRKTWSKLKRKIFAGLFSVRRAGTLKQMNGLLPLRFRWSV